MNINTSYLCHVTNYRKIRKNQIKYIVVHYVGATGSAKKNALYYHNTANIGASAHYFVGHKSENGEIYQSVADNYCAWHCGSENGKYYNDCRNDSAIGIEMCCHKDSGGSWYFDEITVKNTIELVKMLMKKYNIPIANVLRHYDVTHKCCPEPYVKYPDLWNKFKSEAVKMRELESINDIVWELAHRGIITDKAYWIKKLEEDKNVYCLAKNMANYR